MKNYRTTPKHISDDTKEITISSSRFTSDKKTERILIIGFDTEYQGIDQSSDNDVLSYQFAAEILNKNGDVEDCRWDGIVIPESTSQSDRLSIPDFLSIIFSEGIERFSDIEIPKTVYLVAHFTRADVPAFNEFKDDESRRTLNLDNIRNTFVNVSKTIRVEISDTETGAKNQLNVSIRDSLHLSPTGYKSLQKIGEILGNDKVVLAENPTDELAIKQNMKSLLDNDWELFRRYALQDAVICLDYTIHMIRLNQRHTEKFTLPLTLTGIGVNLLTKFWNDQDLDPLEMVGREIHKEKVWSKKKERYVLKTTTPYLKKLSWHETIFTEAYHGGRNEQYWFGPLEESIWYDYDLTSAYPSVMSMIGYPDWDSIRSIKDIDELLSFRPIDLAIANINFEFPETVAYPCIPIRQEGGLVFPLKGNATTHISEILLAKKLGAKIEFVEGRIVQSKRHKLSNDEIRPFLGFAQTCIEQRNKHPKKTLENLFWKELINSSYGKTAQGLQKRRVYDLRSDDTKDIGPSKITNPVYASFITGFCRATLSEIMNNLPESVKICSVTTDGFLTTATESQMDDASGGVCAGYYKDARSKLRNQRRRQGDDNERIYEIKHIVKQPLGWRTRGQATIKPATIDDHTDLNDLDETFVLAKAGIKTPHLFNKQQQNDYIVELFFNRKPEDTVKHIQQAGIREIYKYGSDLTGRVVEKTLSMEYDWKRQPVHPKDVEINVKGLDVSKHLSFHTKPWNDIIEYNQSRIRWSQYNSVSKNCLKTTEDLRKYSEYFNDKQILEESGAGKYLKRQDGDLKRLRQQVAIAQGLHRAGTHLLKPHAMGDEKVFPTYKLRARQLAEFLNDLGVPCTKFDIDNDRKKSRKTGWIPQQIPANDNTKDILRRLKIEVFPELEIDQLLTKEASFNLIEK
jgi:hypothetical protein